MLKNLLCLALALLSCLQSPGPRTVLALKTGVLLRLHVVAQSDDPAMQALKAPIRDAVRAAYESAPHRAGDTMLTRTAQCLPALTRAAQEAAREAGYTGEVTLTLGQHAFDRRELEGVIVPAGTYPALIVRLGEARGRNWWGLIDPDWALQASAIPGEGAEGEIRWDWSLQGFLKALWALPAPKAGGAL